MRTKYYYYNTSAIGVAIILDVEHPDINKFGTSTDSAAHTIIAPYQPVNVAYRIGIRGVDGDPKET